MGEKEEWAAADAVCQGRVVMVKSAAQTGTGRLVTQAVVEVAGTWRGVLPGRVVVEYAGGTDGIRGEENGASPVLRPGQERLFFLAKGIKGGALRLVHGPAGARRISRQRDGELTLDEMLRLRRYHRWQVEAGPAAGEDLRAFAADPAAGQETAASGGEGDPGAAGLMTDAETGFPARWVAPDRGEAIPYLVDAAQLPAGVSQEQALASVAKAFAAWTAVTGIQFRFEGMQEFQMSAMDVPAADEKIRVQLHDTYGSIPGGSVIAMGGRGWSSVDSVLAAAGGSGGRVQGQEFHKTVRGYVIVRHTSPAFAEVTTLEAALCHEIGHVLGLAHSSQDPAEEDAEKKDAIMFYRTHQDGRGARLGSYDAPVVQRVHPLTDTPPWAYPRYLTAHTSAGPQTQTRPGVNQYTLQGHDRQTGPEGLTLSMTGTEGSANGSFTVTGKVVKFTPAPGLSNGGVGDPQSASFAKMHYRFSDGVNASPWQPVAVMAFRRDTFPSGGGLYGDGMPDQWMETHFGSVSASGPEQGPDDDFDGDGLTNLEEYRLGTNPTMGISRFDATILPGIRLQWLARAWSLYAIESSPDGIHWQFYRGVVPSDIGAAVSVPVDPAVQRQFLRIRQMQ